MNNNKVPYIIISILTLIYLFFFSSRLLHLTNLDPIIFNLISSAIVFCYLDMSYKLFIKSYQLNKLELSFVFSSYFVILIYLVFFKNSTVLDSSALNFIPAFFSYPNATEFNFLVGSIIMFIPIGYFYKRFNLKVSLLFILALAGLIKGAQYLLDGTLDLSDAPLYIIGFYFGYFYYLSVNKKSKKYANVSYDISLVFTLMIILFTLLIIANYLFF